MREVPVHIFTRHMYVVNAHFRVVFAVHVATEYGKKCYNNTYLQPYS